MNDSHWHNRRQSALFHWLHYTFCHLWGVLKLTLAWKLLLLVKTTICPLLLHLLRSVVLCNGLNSEGGRKPWTMFQVPVADSYIGFIIKLLLECISIYKLMTPLYKFPIGSIIIFTTKLLIVSVPNPGLIWVRSIATGKIRI